MKNNASHFTDKELINRFKLNDENAFNELIDRHKKMAFSLAYNMTGSIEDAEDISQEAFAIVYTQIAKFRGQSSFKTWFYRIVLNLCRRHYRKNQLISIIPLHFFDKEGEEREIDVKVESTPESELSAKQIGKSIMTAITKLPIKQREVFVMKHLKGMKISEISEILGCAEGTVKTHLFRAIQKLQERLRDFL
jgi:RNA polymerase sigma-70 factor (ECF subfamily)